MKEKIKITEEMGIHKDWYNDAKNQNMETLTPFINSILSDYHHDYGTICHALAASAIAAARAANKTDVGGISGFQAGCVMWEFIKNWMSLDGPLRLIKYEEMLYPQYAHKFEKFITPEIMKLLQEKAKENYDKSLKEKVEEDFMNKKLFLRYNAELTGLTLEFRNIYGNLSCLALFLLVIQLKRIIKHVRKQGNSPRHLIKRSLDKQRKNHNSKSG